MEVFLAIFLVIIMAFTISFISIIMYCYNGILELHSEDDGDSIKLNINEYDMIKKKKMIILFINKN